MDPFLFACFFLHESAEQGKVVVTFVCGTLDGQPTLRQLTFDLMLVHMDSECNNTPLHRKLPQAFWSNLYYLRGWSLADFSFSSFVLRYINSFFPPNETLISALEIHLYARAWRKKSHLSPVTHLANLRSGPSKLLLIESNRFLFSWIKSCNCLSVAHASGWLQITFHN